MDRRRIKTELLIHDLKNPLAIIETGIESLIRNSDTFGPSSERHLRVLGRVLRNSKIAMSLVNDILEVGRSNEGIIKRKDHMCHEYIIDPFIEIFDLLDPKVAEEIGAVKNITDFISILAGQDIILNIESSLWAETLCLDSRKVKQIFRNLLSNAVKYRDSKITIDITKDDRCLSFAVADDGSGIEEEYQKKIFENYFQLGEDRNDCMRGHGLGLAGALILVEDMGGELTLKSERGKGARFTVTLPLT